jgi:hypothetical protein
VAVTTCNTLFTVYIMLALSTETQSSVLCVVASSGCVIFYEAGV